MPERSRAALVTRRITAWTAGWVLAAALYLLLIDIIDLPELIVGAGAAVLAATGLELVREQGIVGESIRRRWLLRLPKPLFRVPADIALVTLVAFRALLQPRKSHGGFRAVRFASGGDQQLDSGRRAMAEAFGSFAPNTIVAGVDPETKLILAHQLKRTGEREAVDPLELG